MSKADTPRAGAAHDPLDDFQIQNLTFHGKTKRVYVAGQGPAVVVMTEMPGIHPLVGRFARWVRDAGFTVWMPSLFGTDGKPVSLGYGLGSMARGCISREFRAFAANESGPVVDWLRALSAHAFPISGGKGVGAIGMCFTGNFALSMMLEPSMLAPVLAQPSLPIGKAGGMHIAPDELRQVKARMEREDFRNGGGPDTRFMHDAPEKDSISRALYARTYKYLMRPRVEYQNTARKALKQSIQICNDVQHSLETATHALARIARDGPRKRKVAISALDDLCLDSEEAERVANDGYGAMPLGLAKDSEEHFEED
jgi:dienelactone hydrolase